MQNDTGPKDDEMVKVTVYMPLITKERLAMRAKRSHRSTSAQVVHEIDQEASSTDTEGDTS